MKTLTVVALKGGVGKSTTSVTTAQHAALNRKLLTLVIDLDGQGNSTLTLKTGGQAFESCVTSDELFTDPQAADRIENMNFVVIGANAQNLRVMERHESKRNEYAGNFRRNLAALDDRFDVCIIDTPPSTDIRLLSALASTDTAISPLELNQECISGMRPLMTDPQTGINALKASINPNLDFLGFVPSRVVSGPGFQSDNLVNLLANVGQYMFKAEPVEGVDSRAMIIPHSIAFPESAASGRAIFDAEKSTGLKQWRKVAHVYDELVTRTIETGKG